MTNIPFIIVTLLACISALLFPGMLIWFIWFGPSPELGKLCLTNFIVLPTLAAIADVLS